MIIIDAEDVFYQKRIQTQKTLKISKVLIRSMHPLFRKKQVKFQLILLLNANCYSLMSFLFPKIQPITFFVSKANKNLNQQPVWKLSQRSFNKKQCLIQPCPVWNKQKKLRIGNLFSFSIWIYSYVMSRFKSKNNWSNWSRSNSDISN